ncbi:MAG: class I SAM-dependent methyltransferase [Wenzhouxiangellaceae bacterium]|nr:class I SAM-dependent methyltransferase [Wenzhouxiangellaceae bacterium]
MTDWYTDEDFWRTFGPLMFSEQQFNDAERQMPELLKRIGLEQGAVLDLGCGPGRHSLPLARAGLEVTAVDTSGFLLDQLSQRAGNQSLSLEIIQDDMRSFCRPDQFDAVLVMWTSFGYFEDEVDHRKVLDNIKKSLKPGGRLVLDLVGLETLCHTLQPVHLTEYDDGRLLIERPLLADHNTRLENEWLLIEGDQVHRTDFSHRVWSAGEITCLLDDAGLAVEAIDADFEGTPYDFESERMIVFAQRR